MRRLAQLALNDEGFIFDPHTGDSFHVSETGLFILRALKEGRGDDEVAQSLCDEYDLLLEDARRDCADFRSHLRNYGLV